MLTLHQRAKDIFLAALEQPDHNRAAFLTAACGDDTGLRQEVESLLQYHDGDERDGRDTDAGSETLFAPGEVFAGRYRMIRRIGRGGMGDVWRADDLVLQTSVALKVIYSASADG